MIKNDVKSSLRTPNNKDHIRKSSTLPNPNSEFSKQPQSYAPFGSVSPRQKKINNKKKSIPTVDTPAPGAYDISLPIIQPVIQTIRKKNNNIIVKLSHIGTSSFQGQNERFKTQKNLKQKVNLGPGKYSPQKFDNLSKSRQVIPEQSSKYNLHEEVVDEGYAKNNQNKQKKRKHAGIQVSKLIKNRQKGAATIPKINKIEIEEYIEMPILEDDLLKKQRQKQQSDRLKRIKGSSWSMMKEDRIVIPSINRQSGEKAIGNGKQISKPDGRHYESNVAGSRLGYNINNNYLAGSNEKQRQFQRHLKAKSQHYYYLSQQQQKSQNERDYGASSGNSPHFQPLQNSAVIRNSPVAHSNQHQHHTAHLQPNNLSPSFRSESVRSFFDQIYYDTNHQQKAHLRQLSKYKSNSIGPGSYDIASKRLEVNRKTNLYDRDGDDCYVLNDGSHHNNKFQFFGSTQERKLL